MTVDEFTRLKKTVESRQREYDQEAGAVKQLKREHGVKSVDDGKAQLLELQRREVELEKDIAEESKKFMAEYGELLKG